MIRVMKSLKPGDRIEITWHTSRTGTKSSKRLVEHGWGGYPDFEAPDGSDVILSGKGETPGGIQDLGPGQGATGIIWTMGWGKPDLDVYNIEKF
jgi:hypothetical protein